MQTDPTVFPILSHKITRVVDCTRKTILGTKRAEKHLSIEVVGLLFGMAYDFGERFALVVKQQGSNRRVSRFFAEVGLGAVYRDAALAEDLGEVAYENQTWIRHVASNAEGLAVGRHGAHEVAGVVVWYTMDESAVVGDLRTADMVLELYLGNLGGGVKHLGNTAYRTAAEDDIHGVILIG